MGWNAGSLASLYKAVPLADEAFDLGAPLAAFYRLVEEAQRMLAANPSAKRHKLAHSLMMDAIPHAGPQFTLWD